MLSASVLKSTASGIVFLKDLVYSEITINKIRVGDDENLKLERAQMVALRCRDQCNLAAMVPSGIKTRVGLIWGWLRSQWRHNSRWATWRLKRLHPDGDEERSKCFEEVELYAVLLQRYITPVP
jgi:hypothetical protein